MRRRTFLRLPVATGGAALGLLAGPSWTARAAGDLHAHDAWIREAPPVAKVLAGYLVLHNEGKRPRALTGASSPLFAKATLHQSREEGGVVRMVHVERLAIPPGRAVALAPGGYHLMLIGPHRALKAGEWVPIRLRFADGASLEVNFEVRQAR